MIGIGFGLMVDMIVREDVDHGSVSLVEGSTKKLRLIAWAKSDMASVLAGSLTD